MKIDIKKMALVIFVALIVCITTNTYATDEVTTRDLALLASLVYEPAPDDGLYDGVNVGDSKSCIFENNQIKKGVSCSFTYPNTYVKWKGKKYNVQKYIEGLSERKKNLFTVITTAHVEDGMLYYFLNFVNPNELVDSGWVIDHVSSRPDSNEKTGWQGKFYAITFKRNDNYVIAYRGTDYPDVFEWLQDIGYAGGIHDQALEAYRYAQAEYNRIYRENKNAKVYTTGHSLGGYLAQIGGAAIIDLGKENADVQSQNPSNINVTEGKLTTNRKMDANTYRVTYSYNRLNGKLYTSNFKGAFYFNGMGISAIGVNLSDFNKKFNADIANALVYLSMFDENGNPASGDRSLNYSDATRSSGRLILYSMTADPVSGIGLHYGEIIKLKAGADAIGNHNGKHILLKGFSKANAFVINTANTIATYINQFINNIKDSVGISKQEAEVKYTELASESIVSIASGMDVLDDSETSNNDIPQITEEAIKAKNKLGNFNLIAVPNLINALKSSAVYYGAGSILEMANIGHETDSFTCLIDHKKTKTVEKNGEKKIYSIGTPEVEIVSKDNKSAEMEAKHTMYVNGKDKITLIADVKDGCAKKYVWTRRKNGKEEIIKGDDKESIKDYYENYYDISKNYSSKQSDGTEEIYKVYVYYGDTFEDWKLNVLETFYSYDTENLRGENHVITAEYKVIYDKTAPSCSFSPSYESIKQGDNSTIILKCTDASSLDLDASNIKLTDTLFNPRLTISSKSCDNKNKKCSVTIHAEKVLLSLARKTMKLSYDGKITDSAGNSTSVSSINVEWVRK